MRRFCFEALSGEEADQLFERLLSGGEMEVAVAEGGDKETVHEGMSTRN